MTTNEKIQSLFACLIYSANKLCWARKVNGGWTAILPGNRRIHVYTNCLVRITGEFDEDFVPPEDLNHPCTAELRFELAQTVDQIYRDRSAIIDTVLAELDKL